VGTVVATGLIALPGGGAPIAAELGAVPAFGSITAFADLLTAVLLIGQAQATQSRAAMHLAAAYLFSFLTVIPDLLAFPGAFSGGLILGSDGTAGWLWCIWHAGFALFVGSFALCARHDGPARGSGYGILAIAVVAAVGAVLAATLGLSHLPPVFVGNDDARVNALGIGSLVAACNAGALALVLTRLRKHNTVTLWLAVAMVGTCLDVVLSIAGEGRYTVGWYLGRIFGLIGHITVFMALLFESMRLYSRVSEANRHLERLSLTDQLTQLPNRRAFEANFALEWRRAEREMLPISLLMIDIDRFKGFNDRFGHPAGDRCLRVVADTIGLLARRPLDLAARLGGEEFVLLLPSTDAVGAAWMGERVRGAVAALAIANPGMMPGIVTVSVGVATDYPNPGDGHAATLIERADVALYDAKRDGRNKVHVAHGGPEMDYKFDAAAWSAGDSIPQSAP
jgi:diguanylate cyclase (GGDEF)-like protein